MIIYNFTQILSLLSRLDYQHVLMHIYMTTCLCRLRRKITRLTCVSENKICLMHAQGATKHLTNKWSRICTRTMKRKDSRTSVRSQWLEGRGKGTALCNNPCQLCREHTVPELQFPLPLPGPVSEIFAKDHPQRQNDYETSQLK